LDKILTLNRMSYSQLFYVLSICVLYACSWQSDQPPKSAVDGMVLIPSGVYDMGGDNEQASRNEYPKHQVIIESFLMDESEVTNEEFSSFVKETGYITIAEQPINWDELKEQLAPGTPKPPDSVLMPGALVFTAPDRVNGYTDVSQWWQWQIGANWRHPTGPNSDISHIMNHPVVQIAWKDAKAYADWAGKRLPTESEWEWAARGGLINMIYPWGNESVNSGQAKANYFQGLFPVSNTALDGYTGTAPVRSYEPNGYGLYDMAGNVWEWCADWYDVGFYATKKNAHGNLMPQRAFNPELPYEDEKVIRGGSFLCNDDYCSGYRNARRMGSATDTGLNHTGFRCVKSL
jgi:formylglycine-generating enzyme required for sulfatase activity